MKRTIVALCLAFPIVLNASGPSAEELALAKARRYGAQAKECLRVVDQDGMPVADARIWGGLQTGEGYNDFIPIQGNTNTNGEYVIQGRCTNIIRCDITKEGYYDSEFSLSNYGYRHTFEEGKWLPYGEMTTIVLKKITSPIPMKHAKPNLTPPPNSGEWCGYDIEHRQWVSKESVGLHSDMLVKITTESKDDVSDFQAVMEISFTNNPYAGAYLMQKDKYSEMKSVYRADTNATYQASFKFIYERHPIIREKPVKHISGMNETDTRLDANSYLVFRTRTEVDADGKLISAHYGKIYGVWEFFGGMRAANVQFNPTPNDINLEDSETAERTLTRKRQREEPPYKKKRKSLWPF